MIEIIVTTKLGGQFIFRNDISWDNFLANLTMAQAVVAPGFYIPIASIDSITPKPEPGGAIAPRSMAEVIHLVPKPEPPKGAA